MSIPTYQGAATLLPAVIDCLENELPDVLTAASAGLGFTLDDVRSFWRGEMLPANWNSPGVGVWLEASRHTDPAGLNLYDVDHTIVVSLVVSGDNADAATLSEFTDAVNAYAQAVSYTLNRYFIASDTDTAYGADVGAIRVLTIDTTPLPVEDIDGGQFLAHTQIRISIMQRVARWEP